GPSGRHAPVRPAGPGGRRSPPDRLGLGQGRRTGLRGAPGDCRESCGTVLAIERKRARLSAAGCTAGLAAGECAVLMEAVKSVSMKWLRSVVCALATSCALPALADTVWLKNGDRLTGAIKAFGGGKLVLQAPCAGEMSISWSSVATLESDQALMIKQNQCEGEVARSLQ